MLRCTGVVYLYVLGLPCRNLNLEDEYVPERFDLKDGLLEGRRVKFTVGLSLHYAYGVYH